MYVLHSDTCAVPHTHNTEQIKPWPKLKKKGQSHNDMKNMTASWNISECLSANQEGKRSFLDKQTAVDEHVIEPQPCCAC